ncbi:MAG: hypothetical protein KF861_10080 [Planctomycetaceae bacterium]|nr:hypothetical protein [Planctomycetaceae bacterium]
MHRTIPVVLLLFVIAMGAADDQRSPQAPPLTPVEAIARIGEPEIRVQMVVKASKERLEKRGIIFLDSKEDFVDAENLGIAVSAKVAQAFKQQGIDDLAAHLKGRTIEVTGCVMRFEERPYLPVLSPEQIKILDAE